MIGKVVLAGGPKCPVCGKEFSPEVPLRPNVEDREFYGGRVNFFKKVTCDCEAEYDLCIEKRFDSIKEDETLRVINMIVLKEGRPLQEIEREKHEALEIEANQKAVEAMEKAREEGGKMPTLKERQEIRREAVLATVVDREAKMDTLMHMTIKELRRMCKLRKIKYLATENKTTLAEKLLVYDPAVVVPNPKG